MTTNNRYDRLNELEEVESETPLLTDEWIQAPDGSWVRSSDKVARKLVKKGKPKSEPEPKSKPARAVEPEPEPAPKAEPKRGLFGRRSAEKQRKAELERERKAELERQAELERERRAEQQRQAELERERIAELERQAEIERQRKADLEYEEELERERQAELAREAELERARKAELERERKTERERQAELERGRKAELQLQAQLERERKAELERERKQAELERKAEQKRGRKRKVDQEREAELERERQAELARTTKAENKSPFFSESDRLLARWPEATSEYPAEPEPWVSTTTWPEDEHEYEPKHEPKHHATPSVRLSAGQRVTQVAIATGLVAATLVIGAAINWLSPDLDRSQRPFANSGEPGESLDVRTFTITVQTARAMTSVQSGQTPQDTQGTWVIVRVRLTANTEPTRIAYAALRDRAGNTYLASDRLTQPLLDGKRTFQPGIPIEGEVVFEVPKDALGGLTALFAARPEMLAFDAIAAVELPAMTVAADQPPATLAPNEVRP